MTNTETATMTTDEQKQMTTEQLAALETEQIRNFATIDSAQNGLDSAAFQVRKRYLPHLNNNTCYDLVYWIVFGTDVNFRRFGDSY